MKKVCAAIVASSSISAVVNLAAQENEELIIEPLIGTVNLEEIQSDDSETNNDYTVRKFAATIPGGASNTYIPLGRFRYGLIHQLEIRTAGSAGNSSCICTFSCTWGGRIFVHTIDQTNWQSRFVLYSYKSGQQRGLVLKYLNSSVQTNVVNVVHKSIGTNAWSAETNQEFLDGEIAKIHTDPEAYQLKAGIEQHSGIDYPSDGLSAGIFINRRTTHREDLILEGDVILSKEQGDISMGAFGN